MKNPISHLLFYTVIIGTCHGVLRGKDADIKDYPYMVYLKYLYDDPMEDSFRCGGSIVNENTVFTVAYCFGPKNVTENADELKKFTIHAGTSRLDKNGNVYHIESVKIHPDWTIDNPYENNIAIVKLGQPIPFDDTKQPVELPTKDIKHKSSANLTGWGYTSPHFYQLAKTLQKATVKVVDPKHCTMKEVGISIPENTAFCSVDTRLYQGVARPGDSGDPLAIGNVLVGIALRSSLLSDVDIYTNVYGFLDFIKENL